MLEFKIILAVYGNIIIIVNFIQS